MSANCVMILCRALTSSASGSVIEGARSVLFDGVERDTDTVVTPTVNGVDLSMFLRSRMSPEQFRYRLALPADARLRSDDGGAIVLRDGVTLARIPALSARDSQGSPIPARMLVVGDELVVKVPHRKREVAYPLIVDPEFVTISAVLSEFLSAGLDSNDEPTPYYSAGVNRGHVAA